MSNPFDDETMMVLLGIPEMPDMGNRHIEKGPMEGMPEGDAEKVLCDIYCMLKEYFKDKDPEGEECREEDEDEL